MKHYRKTCCHCGRETHPQPQDFNHDTGYGHCYDCLRRDDWYVRLTLPADPYLLEIYINRPRVGAPLCSDDSDGKVVELFLGDELLVHYTVHIPVGEIVKNFNESKHKTRFTMEALVVRGEDHGICSQGKGFSI